VFTNGHMLCIVYKCGVCLGYVHYCCVCKTVPESAILAQASQARLGEICRDSITGSAEHFAQVGCFGFVRQAILLTRVCLA